ncbi:RNA-directed DNA polymerase, eukaryota [Tanacetum coccineum]
MEFNSEGRIVWVEIKGIPFKLWSGNTFKRIASKWGELLHIDDQEDKCFHSKRICIYTKFEKNIFEAFKIIFRGKVFWIRVKEAPGWVLDFLEESEDEDESDDGSKEGDSKVHDMGIYRGDSDVEEVLETLFEERGQNNNKLDEASTGQQENHSEDPFSIYTLLKKKKEIAEKDINTEHSLKYPPVFTPNDESVCSGHFKKSVAPRTGGSLLSLMDELVKVGQTMGYKMDGCQSNMTEIIESQGAKEVNFLALQETKMENMEIFSVEMCVATGKDLLIVAVYAPHDFKDKQVLWDYLTHMITNWQGEVVIMGDFNEVRYKSDRFRSVFNVQGANVFNSFIANAGLKEVPLGDHRPILLRESHFDYGQTPFRFFHYWFQMDGFNKLVEDAWSEAPAMTLMR